MENNIDLKEHIKNYDYVRIDKNNSIYNFEDIKKDKNLTMFQSSLDTFWVVNEPKFLESGISTDSIDLYIKNISFDIIDKFSEFQKNIIDISLNLGVFSNFIHETPLTYLNYDFNFEHFNFKLLEKKCNISFVISGLPNVSGKIIETSKNIYIIHKQSDEKSVLYYKYALLSEKTNKTVKIINFYQEQLDVILTEYKFDNAEFISTKSLSYRLNNFMIEKDQFIDLIKSFDVVNSFEVFPQADNFKLVWGLFENLENKEYDKNEITDLIYKIRGGVVDRQINYYISAMLYLDLLLEPKKGIYKLSLNALKMKEANLQKQITYLAQSVLRQEIFYKSFEMFLEEGKIPDNQVIARIINEVYPYEFQESTARRRATTVRSWLNWIIDKMY